MSEQVLGINPKFIECENKINLSVELINQEKLIRSLLIMIVCENAKNENKTLSTNKLLDVLPTNLLDYISEEQILEMITWNIKDYLKVSLG